MEIKSSNWFEVKVTYRGLTESGEKKQVTELWIIEAISFTEAETLMIQYANEYSMEDIVINTLKRADFNEILFSENSEDDKWYKVKMAYIEINERTEKEKRTYINYFVQACNIDKANAYTKEMMNGSMSDYVIESVKETKFVDVIEYKKAD